MKKTFYRDYATEAFRLYARLGSSEKYRQALWNEALLEQAQNAPGSGISCPSEAAIIRAEQRVHEAVATIADLEAVEHALCIVELKGVARVKALKMVYFADPFRDIKRGEIKDRVNRASILIPASEPTIYRWLAEARELFALKRGLRIS